MRNLWAVPPPVGESIKGLEDSKKSKNFKDFKLNMKNSGPFSEYHLMILLTYYIDNKRPTTDEIAEIAEKLNRTKDSIRRWFRRKYAKENKARREKRALEPPVISYSPPAKIRKASPFSEDHRNILRIFFKTNQTPSNDEMSHLSEKLGCKIEEIQRWFRLKRQTERKRSNDDKKEAPEKEEEEKTEILSTTVSEKLFYGGPILRWDGKVVGRVTAEDIRQYF